MKHGQEIRRYVKTSYGPSVTLEDATTGRAFYTGPLCSSSESMRVIHCDTCGEVELGFFGSIVHDRACPNCGKEWKL